MERRLRNGGFTGRPRGLGAAAAAASRRATSRRRTTDPDSLLNFYRRLIRLRQSEPALASGDFRAVETGREDVIAWQRSLDGRTLTVVANLGGDSVPSLRLAGVEGPLDDLLDGTSVNAGTGIALAPRTTRVLAPSRIAAAR